MTWMASAAPVPSGTEGHPVDALDAAIGVITRPGTTMREIAATRRWLAGLLLSLVSSVLYGLATLAAPPWTSRASPCCRPRSRVSWR
jgi:hypothetical protein